MLGLWSVLRSRRPDITTSYTDACTQRFSFFASSAARRAFKRATLASQNRMPAATSPGEGADRLLDRDRDCRLDDEGAEALAAGAPGGVRGGVPGGVPGGVTGEGSIR